MRSFFWGPFLICVFVFLDQASKWWVLEKIFRRELGLGDPMRFIDWLEQAPDFLPPVTIPLTSFFNLSMVWNTGISFGFLGTMAPGLLMLVMLVISSVFFIWMLRSHAFPEILALSLIIGGAVGNVIDRFRFGAVADFLDFHWGQWHFPAFNLADSAISAGVALLLIHSLFFAQKTV